MTRSSGQASGRLVRVEHTSHVLAGNPLGDPHVRAFDVWLPPGYDQARGGGRGRRYPVLFSLAGFTNSGLGQTSWKAFGENLPERLGRLVREASIVPCIVVFPDCFTSLGGNQYINSTAVGRYADYLTRELIPFVDAEFRTKPGREHRGCFGKSSGGYGALVHGMIYARYWGAVASHAGDCGFDIVYRPDWAGVLDTLAKYRRGSRSRHGARAPGRGELALSDGADDGRIRAFLESFSANDAPSGSDVMCLMMLAMAATYDPDPAAPNRFRVPVDLDTGELIARRWRQWLRHDPVNMVRRYADRLKTLRKIFIDCGWRDQYRMHYGNRQLSAALHAYGVKHTYEEFDGTHSGIDYRLDRSLPILSRAVR
ncbi:MAG: alpha/beta hydrolase-fold protein [Gammaproteobacteria bacterium]|jgi:enterochelin esterase-like enzyme